MCRLLVFTKAEYFLTCFHCWQVIFSEVWLVNHIYVHGWGAVDEGAPVKENQQMNRKNTPSLINYLNKPVSNMYIIWNFLLVYVYFLFYFKPPKKKKKIKATLGDTNWWLQNAAADAEGTWQDYWGGTKRPPLSGWGPCSEVEGLYSSSLLLFYFYFNFGW